MIDNTFEEQRRAFKENNFRRKMEDKTGLINRARVQIINIKKEETNSGTKK